MPRPGFVLEVDERTPPLLVHEGEGFRTQRFPVGTRPVDAQRLVAGGMEVGRADETHPLRIARPRVDR